MEFGPSREKLAREWSATLPNPLSIALDATQLNNRPGT
jgi:hypothetical protein